VSNNAKWVISVICAIVGVIALIVAVIYLAVPIHSLPGFIPGKKAVGGHYHKRAFISAVIGVVLLAIAAYLGMTARRSTSSAGSVGGSAPAGSVPSSVGNEGSAGSS
jgi:uncharacterized membrane protein